MFCQRLAVGLSEPEQLLLRASILGGVVHVAAWTVEVTGCTTKAIVMCGACRLLRGTLYNVCDHQGVFDADRQGCCL